MSFTQDEPKGSRALRDITKDITNMDDNNSK
jgi:hypothetical protein